MTAPDHDPQPRAILDPAFNDRHLLDGVGAQCAVIDGRQASDNYDRRMELARQIGLVRANVWYALLILRQPSRDPERDREEIRECLQLVMDETA